MWLLDITDEARDNIAAIEDYIADQVGAGIAENFADALIARCHRLAGLPGILGTARPDLGENLRSTPHKGYVIFFRYIDDTLEIVSILAARRDALAYFTPDDEA